MKNQNDIFLNNLPSIDLHGFDRESATLAVKDFIQGKNVMGNKKIIVIHGKGQGILRESILSYLKNDKLVLSYKLDNFNDGITVVSLKVDK